MKEIQCDNCGDVITSGYAINPEVSALCETCYKLKTGELTENDL